MTQPPGRARAGGRVGGAGRECSLGARLRQVRERQGLSLGTVASMLNIPREQLARIEAGTLTHGRFVDRVARWLRPPGGWGHA